MSQAEFSESLNLSRYSRIKASRCVFESEPLQIAFNELKEELLTDPEVKKEYDALALEYEIAHALILARTEAKMTQLEVAAKMHTMQSVIARLEGSPQKTELKAR